jgi:hypothetical protein
MGRRRIGLDRDESGVGQVVAMVTAGAVFFATLGALLLATNQVATDRSPSDTAAKRMEARSLADILVSSPGVGWTGGPDGLQRLGLSASNGSGLDQASLDALRGGMAASTANGKVDYPDALASLGLDPAGQSGFHLRIYPVGLDTLHGQAMSNLKVAYVADWTSLVTVKVAWTTPQSEMSAQANVQLNLTMAANTVKERQSMRDLGVKFTDRIYVTTTTPTILVDYPDPLVDLPMLTVLNVPLLEGDVYPDSKAYLDSVLAARLTRARYDVLVVGSGVDHSTLNSNDVKTAVRAFVLNGGSLVVLGSDEKSTAWLNPLLNAGVATVNGAPVAPDVSHPLLKEPWVLAWTSYDSKGQAWDIKDSGGVAAYQDFSHVVLQGGDDVLTVSKQAAFGQGQVILTTYRARDIAVAQGQTEADHFFENMLSYTDRTRLYLDYGGTVPADQPVSLAVRESWLWDSIYGQVPVRIEVLAWGPLGESS